MKTQNRPGLVLATSAVAVYLVFVDVGLVNIAFPDLQRAFPSVTPADLSWVLTAYNLVFAALLVVAGRLADLAGRRRVFRAGAALFGIASLACALAPTVEVLVAARAVQAAAAALITPASLALLLPAFPPERRASAIGIWGATGGVAVAVGPSLGGLLVDTWGWRAVFLVNAPLALGVAVVAGRTLVEARDPDSRLPDLASVALLVLGLGAVTLGIVRSVEWTWTDPRTLTALGAGLAALGVLAWRSARVATPIVEPALFRLRTFTAATLGSFTFSVGFYAMLLANVLFLTAVWGFDVLAAGLGVAPGPVMAAVGSAVAGRVVDRLGPRAALVPGGLLFAAGAALFALRLGPEPAYLAVFLPATILTGTGVGVVFAGLSAAVVAELPPARYATGSAVGTCARQLGAVLGVAALLSVVTAAGPDVLPGLYALMAVGGLTAVAAGLAVGRPRVASPA